MRAFFCIPIDDSLRREIARLAEGLRGGTKARVSWVERGNYHVTLRFLGEIDPMLTADLERITREVASAIGPFQLTVDRVSAFPTVDRPRVIWVGGKASPEFLNLCFALNSRLEQLGFPRVRDEKVVHITIARVKGRVDPGLEARLRSASLPPRLLPVERVVLMESRLSPRGAVYSPLFTVFLGKDG